jgi:hypothetical protein
VTTLDRLRRLVDLDPYDQSALDALVRAHRQRGEIEEAAMLGDVDSLCELAQQAPSVWLGCLQVHPSRYGSFIVPGLAGRVTNYGLGADIKLRAQYPAWIMRAPERARFVLLCVAYGLPRRNVVQPPPIGKREAVGVEYEIREGMALRAHGSVFGRAKCRFYGRDARRRDMVLTTNAPTVRLARLRLAREICDRLLRPHQGFDPTLTTPAQEIHVHLAR